MALLLGYVELIAAILCYFLILKLRRDRETKLPSWPVLGMLPELLMNVSRAHEFITENLRKCGGTLEFNGPWMTALKFFVTSDPKNVQHILTANYVNYPKGPRFRELFDALGGGIFNVDSEAWRSQRKMFHQLLLGSQNKFSSFVSRTMRRKVVEDLIPDLDEACTTGVEIDLQKVLQRLTFDNTFAVIFGADSPLYRSLKLPVLEYQKAFAEMEEAGWHRHILPDFVWKLQRWLQVGGERRIRHARTVFDDFLFHCVSLKRQHYLVSLQAKTPDQTSLATPTEPETDLMSIYLQEGTEFSDKFLRDTAFNFMVAGISSVNACMTWFFWLVATHPNAEAKILDEIRQSGDANGRDIDGGLFGQEELAGMTYLHAAFLETLRLYPPVPFNEKSAAAEDVLPSGHRVGPGAKILTSFYAMGRSEDIWGKDCLEFRPERWVSERGGIVYVPTYKFAPFSTGPRSCIGKDLALLQMKTVAAAVLWNYRLAPVEGHPIAPTVSIVLHMEHGLKVRVSKRNTALDGN